MIGFRILENISVENYRTELTLTDINDIVDAFAAGKDISTVRSELKLTKNIIKAAYEDIQEVANTVYKLMNGQSVLQKATYNEDGTVNTPTDFYPIPATLQELKTSTWELIARDFDKKVSANYDVADIAELQSKVELLVDKTIEYSKADGSGDWTFFESKF